MNALFDKNMNQILILLWIFLITTSRIYADTSNPEISVTLDRATEDQETLVIKITNNGEEPFQFLDLQGGGVGDCSEFYTLVLRTPQGDLDANGCGYAEDEIPKLVLIPSGETHIKKIDPKAYRFPDVYRLKAPYKISVRYKVSGMSNIIKLVDGKHVRKVIPNKEKYSAMHKGLDVNFEFQTNFISVKK
ncbi:MAG: hypothetical protein RLZZ505_2342 [Verrucomicrobiota bacterium]|jgi:hypothetical protein